MGKATAMARAHTNIALVKYWGKADTDLIIPMNNSFSLTLDHFYTDTKVTFSNDLQADEFILNDKQQETTKITPFMNLVRQMANKNCFAKIESTNHVPTAAGLASSASAYAALAKAASVAAGLNLSDIELSRLARRGSGSACRSIYGGFVEWLKGFDDKSSYAVPFMDKVDWPIQMIAVVVNAQEKKIGSRAGMQTVVETSPYYDAWIQQTAKDIVAIKEALLAQDIDKFGQIAEENAMKMHALNLSASPHFSYFEPASLEVMQKVAELRSQGISCYYTMDAGPNVKIICLKKDTPAILAALGTMFNKEQLLVASPGPGVQLLDC